MTRHHFWCVRCNLHTTNPLTASKHEETTHNDMRKIGTTP